jgi:hypothetical protein
MYARALGMECSEADPILTLDTQISYASVQITKTFWRPGLRSCLHTPRAGRTAAGYDQLGNGNTRCGRGTVRDIRGSSNRTRVLNKALNGIPAASGICGLRPKRPAATSSVAWPMACSMSATSAASRRGGIDLAADRPVGGLPADELVQCWSCWPAAMPWPMGKIAGAYGKPAALLLPAVCFVLMTLYACRGARTAPGATREPRRMTKLSEPTRLSPAAQS